MMPPRGRGNRSLWKILGFGREEAGVELVWSVGKALGRT